ncbi:MAG: family 78 glycoside hydrolase catalytic domain [Thermomicrobiales bacterium]
MTALVAPETYATPVTFSSAAQWIWDGGDPSPRNAWRWFRRTFDLTTPAPAATIRITADTRYRLWVNGTPVGHGPVRGFTAHWFVDTWEIGHLLRSDRPNVVAVHVLHFGVATFTTFRERGGLIADIDLGGNPIGTDAAWKVLTPPIHDPRASRISCQLGFTEQIDARALDADLAWTDPAFDDTAWPNAVPFAAASDGPWGALYPRDIPPLEEAPVRPVGVTQLAFVKPPVLTAGIDMRAQMAPDAANHANHVGYTGFLVSVIRVAHPTTVTVLLPQRKPGLGIAGEWSSWEELDERDQGARSRTVHLPDGDHLLVVDVSFVDHGHTVHLVVDADDPEAITLISPQPFGEADLPETPFITIGPITDITIGTIEESWPQPDPIPAQIACRAEAMTEARDLRAFGDMVRPVPTALVSPASLLANAVHPRERTLAPVSAELQAIAAGNAVQIPAHPGSDTELVLDLGREFSGFIGFDIEAPSGTVLDVYGFEYLDSLSGHREDSTGMENAFRYTTREGRQTYQSPIRRGMRYLQVTVRRPEGVDPDEPVILHELHVTESHFPVSHTGRFRCSDARLDQIWEMSRRTVIACMEDTYVDCPGYEQVFWVGDSYSSARFAAYLFGAEALTRRCLRLVPQSAPQSPLYCSNIPSAWDSVIPNFTFFWTQAVDEHCFRTGDAAFAAEMWPQVRSALEAFTAYLNADDLLEITAWNLLDWAPIDQPNAGVVTHQNCLMVMALEAAGRIATMANEDADAVPLLDTSARLRRAIDTRLWSDDAQAYIDSIHADGTHSTTISVQTQMFALLADVPGDERRDRIESVLVDPPANWVQIGSPWMSIFLYDALAERGHTAAALADARRNYGFMLDRGATTCWEMFPSSNFVSGRGVLSRSHCHAWSAAPAALFPARLLGIRPLAPGWAKVLVAPEPCGLIWAEGSAPHPDAGSVDVRWDLGTDGAMALRITVPKGVEVETRLPDGIQANVTVVEVG